MRKLWIALGGAVVVLVVGAAGFFGGMAFQRSRAANVRSAFFAERDAPGGPGGFGQFFGPQGFEGPFGQAVPEGATGVAGLGRGATGSVKSIEGDTLLLSTAQDVTTVILTDETSIVRLAPVERQDLRPDVRVTVIGQRDEDGQITAAVIQILEEP